MAKYSTWGMWDPEIQELINNIAQDPSLHCTEEEVRTAIFEKVIPECLEAAFKYNEQLIKGKSSLPPQEKQLNAYRVSLDTVLPSLSATLGKTQEALSTHVSNFVDKAFALVSAPEILVYLTTLRTLSIQVKIEIIRSLYGEGLNSTLLPGLQFNDSEVLAMTTEGMSQAIQKNCPDHLLSRMSQHLKFMEEVANNKMASAEYKQLFETETGKTMDAYKAQIAAEKKAASQAEQKDDSFLETVPIGNQNASRKIRPSSRSRDRFSAKSSKEPGNDKEPDKERSLCSCAIS